MTPFTTEVELASAAPGHEIIRVHVLLSTDPGPARGFRHFLDVDLDEANATELLGKLGLALEQLRQRRKVAPGRGAQS